MQVDCIKIQILAYGDIAPLRGAWSESRDSFFKFCPCPNRNWWC